MPMPNNGQRIEINVFEHEEASTEASTLEAVVGAAFHVPMQRAKTLEKQLAAMTLSYEKSLRSNEILRSRVRQLEAKLRQVHMATETEPPTPPENYARQTAQWVDNADAFAAQQEKEADAFAAQQERLHAAQQERLHP